MGVESFRIDFYIYSCQNLEDVLKEIQKSYSLKKDFFVRHFKKYYIKNSFILDGLVKIYLNYEKGTDYVYMCFESCFSNFDKYIKVAYVLYEKLLGSFPIRIKFSDFLNAPNQTISYQEFYNYIKEYYNDKYIFFRSHYNIDGVDLLPGTQFYKKYKKFSKQ